MKLVIYIALATLSTIYANQIVLTQNAIVNPGAEAGPGSGNGNDIEPIIPGWTTTGNFTVVAYGSSNEIATSGGPQFGDNFFAGGPSNASSSATQTLDVSNVEDLIDAGEVNYVLSGYFGGYETQDDNATLTAVFLSATQQSLGQVTIGGDNEVARDGTTELLYASAPGMIPDGTESIVFTLLMTRTEGTYNDGYADNLSFIAVDPPNGQSTPEPAAWSISGLGLAALLWARKRSSAL